jgi:diaminopimelate decarboxylase
VTNYTSTPNFPASWQTIAQKAADTYGTPLFLYFADVMEARLAALKAALPESAKLFYSIKANPNPWIIRFFADHGLNLEVASYGEMAIALSAGVPANRLLLVGPAKPNHELHAAVSTDLAAVVAESEAEVGRLAQMARGQPPVRVALRLNLGRSGGRLTMSGDTQFGMSVESAAAVLSNAPNMQSLQIVGLHTYAGTQQFEPRKLLETTKAMVEIASDLQKRTDSRLTFLDFGGGFGTKVRKGDRDPDWRTLKDGLVPILADYLHRHPWTTTISYESGRFLVGAAGLLVTTVQDVKSSATRTYVLVDGGIAQFGFDDRYYGLRPPTCAVLAPTDAATVTVTLCGPLCTPADRIAVDTVMRLPQRGDRICIFNTGAYGLTGNPGMFLGQGFAAEAVVEAERIRLIRRRFAAEEFTALTALPYIASSEVI